jgi:hydroxyacylglutathione hydrolase
MNDPAMPLRIAILPVTPYQQNCTILWCVETRKAVVIDPGGDVDDIMAAIEELKAAPQARIEVEKIWITHGHIDHFGGVAELKERLGGIPVEGPHKLDEPLMAKVETQAKSMGVEGIRNAKTDRWLEEGQTVSIGKLTFKLFHCPGHSPGSIVFFNEQGRFAVVGDVLFQNSVGRTDLPGGDHDALISAIKTKLLPLGDDINFICGHGAPSSFGRERKLNPFLQD